MRFLRRLSFLAAALVLLIPISTARAQQQTPRDRALEEMLRILDIIASEALDSVDMYQCAQQIQRRGISACLDRYSGYLTAEEMKGFLPSTYAGIGATVKGDGNFVLLFPHPGSPAFKAGVLQGDTLVKIDTTTLSFGSEVTPDDIQNVVGIVRGPEKTIVQLSFLRGGKVIGPIAITRAQVQIDPVVTATLSPTVGYLHLKVFNENATKRMTEALENFKRAGIKKFVLDFRGNPGGFVNQADEIADLFSPGPGNLKITLHYRNRPDQQSFTPARGPYADMKVVLLIDESSASASEMVAGIFQDWKVATLVGTHTYGKGIGQSSFPLFSGPDTPYLKLTTFAFLVGNGKVKITPKTPLQPDIKVEDDLTPAEIAQRKAELRAHNPNKPYLNPKLDKQLAKAIDLLK